MLLYMILRHFGYQWQVIDDFLQQIGDNRCEAAHINGQKIFYL